MIKVIEALNEFFNHTGDHEIHGSNSHEIAVTHENGTYINVIAGDVKAGELDLYNVHATWIDENNEEQELEEVMTGEQVLKYVFKL